MQKYLKLDSRKVTYGEYWDILRSPTVIIPWIAKLLNIPIKFSSGMPYFESVRELEVPEYEFSASARTKLEPMLGRCLALGFHSARFFTYESMRHDIRTSFIALLHPSGATVRLMHTLNVKVQPTKEKTLMVLLTELQDGTFFFTSSQRKQFLSAPNIAANRLIGAGPERLVESHFQKLKEFSSSNPAKPVESVEALDDLWDRYETESREFGIRRGIYAWMTPEEIEKEQGGILEARTMASDSGGGNENMDVMIELAALQNKKAGWSGMLVLFAVSLILFVSVGARQWSWNYLVILLGVLFVHETGHYLAMRAFNYRNLRMFFIPFFGAAVSGQHYNVPGWKKVVVSLMGPVPGIVLGVLLGMVALVIHQTLLLKIAVVSLLINGFNLLPMLPLDGGRVCHTLLFSRNYVLDTVFRILAAIALIAVSAFLKTKVLMYVGIITLIGVPAAYRIARITADLKKRQLPPVSEDDQTISPATAQAIITELKRSTQRPQSNKILAQQTLQIFETLNARPPGWFGTLGLLFAHAASFGTAAIFGIVFLLAQNREFTGILNGSIVLPKHHLIARTQLWKPDGVDAVSTNANVILVATFNGRYNALSAFEALTNQVPTNASLQVLGESVLLSLPSDQDELRKEWLEEFDGRTKNVFVDTTNSHVAFSVSCFAPDNETADTLFNDLNNYFNTLPGESIIPPWQPSDSRSSVERNRNNLARETYLKAQKAEIEGCNDNFLRLLEKKINTARLQGDDALKSSLENQLKTQLNAQKQQAIDRLKNGANGPIDATVIDLYAKLMTEDTLTNKILVKNIRQQLAERMGAFPSLPNTGKLHDDRYLSYYGIVSRQGRQLSVNFISFNYLDRGPLALTDWLLDHRCKYIRYDFLPGGALNDEDAE